MNERYLDFLLILRDSGMASMTTRDVISFSMANRIYDIPDDIQKVSNVAHQLKKHHKMIETVNGEHSLNDLGCAELAKFDERLEKKAAGYKKDDLSTKEQSILVAHVAEPVIAQSFNPAIKLGGTDEQSTAAILDSLVIESDLPHYRAMTELNNLIESVLSSQVTIRDKAEKIETLKLFATTANDTLLFWLNAIVSDLTRLPEAN
jgi:hypothetical protein